METFSLSCQAFVRHFQQALRSPISAPCHHLRKHKLHVMISKPPFSTSLILAACGPSRGIGLAGGLPWPRLPSDLRNFKTLTLGAAVLMGAATYESLPEAVRPLPGRLNVVLSRRSRPELLVPDDVLIAGSFEAAEELLKSKGVENSFVIGGESVYREAIKIQAWSQRVYYTEIDKEFKADRFFPVDLDKEPAFSLVSVSGDIEESGVRYRIKEYIRVSPDDQPSSRAVVCPPHEEEQYLDLLRHILERGVSKGDRTGVGTISVFGAQMRFDLRHSFPLLTTKRVFWRAVAEELFWFIQGSTDANKLAKKGVYIWDGNGSREFLDKRGFPEREVGDLGPVYGFQWRHFGAEYTDMHADYAGKGRDQLKEVIDTVKNNPNDRRILLSAWNPLATDQMALPPCHLLAQFYVANGELSCQMYQRSCDMGLGVPFNIASYALLTCLIAKVTGLKPGDFIHTLGDAHVYNNHVESLREQVQREPRPFPKLSIRERGEIEDFSFEDLTLEGYHPHKKIAMKMAV